MPLSESSAMNVARRAAREITPGAVVALDRGLPELVAQATPASMGAWFLHSDGTLNGMPLSAADAAAIVRGGYVDPSDSTSGSGLCGRELRRSAPFEESRRRRARQRN